MESNELKQRAERQPFRPFGIRLSNGVQYFFAQPRQFGAPENFHVLVFFGEKDVLLIDTDNIVEIFDGQ